MAATSQGKCIFCTRGSLSKEHIWPTWCHPLLKQLGGTHKENVRRHIVGGKVATPKVRELTKQGSILNMRLRVVCEECNNTWMSSLEEQTKPTLLLLMSGCIGEISPHGQKLIAQWATLKSMVAEQSQKDEVVFTHDQREALRLDGSIPSGVTIWIGRSHSGKWLSSFQRCSAHLMISTTPNPQRPTDAERKNVQTTAIGIGQLFLYVVVSNAKTFDLNAIIRPDQVLLKLWPSNGEPILTPLHRFISTSTAEQISLALNTLVVSNHVIAGD